MHKYTKMILVTVMMGVISGSMAISAAEPEPEAIAVAKVNGYVIPAAEFADRLNYVRTPGTWLDRANSLLADLVSNELWIGEALRRGLDNSPSVGMIKRQLLIDAMTAKLTGEKLSDAQVKQYYAEHPEEFKAISIGHIRVTNESEMKEIYEELKKGRDFDEVAKQFKETYNHRGEDLDYVSRSQLALPVEDQVFSLKVNEVSAPIKTGFGHHLIKVRAIKEAHKFYELNAQEVAGVKNYVFRHEINRLKAAATVLVHDDFIRSSAPLNASAPALAEVNGTTITAAIAIDKFDDYTTNQQLYYGDPLGRAELLDELIADELLYQRALAIGLDQDPVFVAAYETPKRVGLLDTIKENTAKAQLSDNQIEQFYADHFQDYRLVKASHIRVNDADLAREIKKQLEEGADFTTLVKRYSQDVTNNVTGELSYSVLWSLLEKPFRDALLSLQVNQVAGPVKTRQGYEIIKVFDIKENPLAFKDLNSEHREHLKLRITNQDLEKLRDAAEIVIYQDEIDAIITKKGG